MRRNGPVVLVEFNELSPTLMERFMAQGEVPNFRRMYSESKIYTTDAEERAPNLNPWIQWVTVHSGMPFSEHGIFHLGEGHKLKTKCIGDVLSDARYKVWVCGSMNVRYEEPINGCILPDPWTTEAKPYPGELSRYFRFVQRQVQENTNDHLSMRAGEYADFMSYMATHGLSASTVRAVIEELVRETFTANRWKRAVIMDKLQWDLFRWHYEKLRPDFSTFFLNSTAHYQHKYWRCMEPQHFAIPSTPQEQEEFGSAILCGYLELR